MKICVYAIAKDEAKHVKRFVESALDADLIVVGDTGSSDGTAELLEKLGVVVHRIAVMPWRFDDARNAVLALVPPDMDICVPLDLDEQLTPGWWRRIESAWAPGTVRLRYPFVWNFDAAGNPLTFFDSDKIHARQGYRWRHPAHECLQWIGEGGEVFAALDGEPLIEHRADDAKPRDYLRPLGQAVRESPHDDRVSHYYGRELFYRGLYDEAISELNRHLGLASSWWSPERCASWRYIAKCWTAKNLPLVSGVKAEHALMQAVHEAPTLREPWLELAELFARRHEWAGALWAVERCLDIKERPGIYISDARCWDGTPEKLLIICCKKLGDLRARAFRRMQDVVIKRGLDIDHVVDQAGA